MRAFYLQDSWSMMDDRLTLQLGVRADRFRNYTQLGDLYYDSKNNWAPRLGLTFDVFGDKRTKFNAFYGEYYLPIATNTNIRLGGAEIYYQQSLHYSAAVGRTDLNRDGIPDALILDDQQHHQLRLLPVRSDLPRWPPDAGEICYASSPTARSARPTRWLPNLKPSKSDEIIVGLSHRFGDGWTVGVDYVRRRLKETLEDVADRPCGSRLLRRRRDRWLR